MRDQVYVLLRIMYGVNIDAYLLLQADYRKDVIAVYVDAVRHFITQP